MKTTTRQKLQLAAAKKGVPSKAKAAPSKKKTAPKKSKLKRATTASPKTPSAKKAIFNTTYLLIIRMICEQLNSHEIAQRLGLNSRTVEEYRGNIMQMMKVKNAAGLVVYAIRHGMYEI